MTLVKRGGKRTRFNPNAWNVKFQDDTITSVDFDREVQTWKTKIHKSYTETINSTENNRNHDNDILKTIQNLSRLEISKPNLSIHRSDEIFFSKIYQLAIDQEVYEERMRELNNWREQIVLVEVPNEDQKTTSVRWAINQKLLTDNTVQKPDSVLENLKNYNFCQQTHQLVKERALKLP